MGKPWEQDWGGSSAEQPAAGSKPWEQDWGASGAAGKRREGGATAADYLQATGSGLAEGVAGIGGGIGTFIQAPIANLKAGALGAVDLADRGISWLINQVEPGAAVANAGNRDAARRASREAAAARDANASAPWNIPARIGRFMQEDSERAVREIRETDRVENPELIAQQEAMARAEGFVGNLAAIKDNPLAFTRNLVRSVPDMALGVGVASKLARAGVGLKGVSAAGAASEAASSAMQGRQGVYQTVIDMPAQTLAQSPRFREILAEAGGDEQRARAILANELADQVPIATGAGTALGTLIANRLFGGDATAKSIIGKDRITPREFGRRVWQDTAEEGIQGVPEDTVQHAAEVQADPSKRFDPGGSLAQNMAAGSAMGAGGHGAAYVRQAAGDLMAGRASAATDPAPAQGSGPTPVPAQAPAAMQAAGVPTAPSAVPAAAAPAPAPVVQPERPTPAEQALRQPVNLTALDRVNELDGELERIARRQQELAPGGEYGPAFDQERAELAQRSRELGVERESIASTWPRAERGAPTSFSTEAGVRLDGQYALLEADDLVTSHDEDLRANPLYPQELQPRDRSRTASEMQVQSIVGKLDPARLGVSADAATGAPIVGADGLVESGNARTIALKRVYQANGQKAADYRAWLVQSAPQFGLQPEAIGGMRRPVLVRVRSTPVNRAEFARQANASTVQRMSPSEQALSDAKRLTSLEGLEPDDDGGFEGSRDFIRQFMGMLPLTEQGDMIEANGRLSTSGYRRIQNAVLAKAYGDSPSLRRMTESMDDTVRNVSKALMRVAPRIAAARERMEAGTLHQADIAPDLLAAVDGLASIKDQGSTVEAELGQADIEGPKYSPEAAQLLTFIADNIRSPRRIADFMQAYYDALESAGDPSQGSLLGEMPAPTRGELLQQAKRGAESEGRGTDRGSAQAAAQGGRQSEDAARGGRGDQGDGPARAVAGTEGQGQQAAGEGASPEWVAFPEDSGTLGIPRARMPQIKGDARGALTTFLAARGISRDEAQDVPAASLKPTQAEFSPAKAARWKDRRGGDRSVLVSADGHILDGHHQWVAALQSGETVRAIRFNAPIRDLLDAVGEFPSATAASGAGGGDILTQPTPEDLRARDDARRKAEAGQAAPAAPEPGDFRLTGSNSTADQAIAAGQMELGAAPAPETEAAAAENEAAKPQDAPPGAVEALRKHGFDSVDWKRGKGFNKDKWQASSGGESGNYHESADAALADLRARLDSAARNAEADARKREVSRQAAEKIRRGEQPTEVELGVIFPGWQAGKGYVRQSAASPFLTEFLGVPKNAIRANIGSAAGTLTSDTGAKYPIVYPMRLARVFGPQASARPKSERSPITPYTARSMRPGDVIVDAEGREYRAHQTRNDWMDAHPIVDGRANVSADTLVRFHLNPETAGAFEERRSDPVYATGRNLSDEADPDGRGRDGLTKAERYERSVEVTGSELAAQFLSAAKDGEFDRLQEVVDQWAKDVNVDALDLRAAVLKALDKFDGTARNKDRIRRALNPLKQAERKLPTKSANTIFTDDAAEKARERLRAKLNRLNSGVDPEMLQDGITLAGWHIENGARTFAAFARAMIGDLGEAVRPYLKSWYMGVRYDPRASGFDGMDSAATVDAADVQAIAVDGQETTEGDDVPGSDARLERDSGEPAAQSAMGGSVSDGAGGAGRGAGRAGGRAGGARGSGQPDGAGAAPGGPPSDGVRGDLGVPPGDGATGSARPAAGSDFAERGPDIGVDGVRVDATPAAAVEAAATRDDLPVAPATSAKPGKVVPGDLANIRETLPQLMPAQQEDVQKAEQRFSKPDGYGMLFTNGTGTGKTFTGLGIIKRFALQGKTNTLVVVPDDKITSDWIESAKLLGLEISQLADTKSAGTGIVITTYANLGENDALARRQWDLVVPDEAHSLMQSADGAVTTYLANLRAITYHPDGEHQRYTMLNRPDIEEVARLNAQIVANNKIINLDDTMDQMASALRDENKALEARADKIKERLNAARNESIKAFEANQGAKRTRLAALSATPFAYEFTIDWANGYLFDYNEGMPADGPSGTAGRPYNSGTNRDRFFMQHFGYTMRYNKLTKPGKDVDSGLLQREFNTWLKRSGSLSGRTLDVKADYDRRFVLIDSAIGNRIDEALTWVSEKSREKGGEAFGILGGAINDSFDYLSRRYLLEAIKATESIPIVKQHLALGRKVVVFHDYKKGGGFNPFDIKPMPESALNPATEEGQRAIALNSALREFRRRFADLVAAPLGSMPSPIEVFKREIPGVLLINGDEKKSDLLARYQRFQSDDTGPSVMLVQSAKNKGWSGHDTTGKYPRVLINLGLPTAPTLIVQQEGRIYRTGQVSNAIFRYLNTGTNWERWAFASTIASRASTQENLGMGDLARALKDSIIASFEESDSYPPGHEGEGTGGKAQDAAANNALSEFDRAKTYYWATQKKTQRTKAEEGVDYFATPEPLGMKMVEWAGVRHGEDVLEPSAGHGAISRWISERANRTVVEPSRVLRSRLAMVMNPARDRIVDSKFEDLGVNNKYDVVVMNPPFGRGGSDAISHLAKAAQHLRDGGRIVALIPVGPTADKRFDAWLNETDEKGRPVRADLRLHREILLPGVTFNRAGAGVMTRVVVIDRHADLARALPQKQSIDLTDARDMADLFERIEGLEIDPRRMTKAQETAQAAGAPAEAPKPAAGTAPKGPKEVNPGAVGTIDRGDAKVIEHTTQKGKVIRGIVRSDLSRAEAEKIDPYTFRKGAGWFIREKYLKPDADDQPVFSRRRVASQSSRADNAPYETDLFGNPLPGADRAAGDSRSARPAVRGDVQPATGVPGDTEAPAGEYFVRTVVGSESRRKLGADRILTAADAAAATRYLYRSAVERFDGIVTDGDGKPLAVVGGFKGALAQAAVYPATIMGEAIRVPGAARIWFSHNHPSGKAALSRADENLGQALANVFRGSGIEPMGILAVAGDEYAFAPANVLDNPERGDIPAGRASAEVPVVEREQLPRAGTKMEAVSSPDAAKRMARGFYAQAKTPGLMLLSAQNDVVAWVPLPKEALGTLRGTGGLRALYRAISEANAGAAVLVHGGEMDALPNLPGRVTAIENIGAALQQIDVSLLDSIDATTGKSRAEQGLNLARGPVYSRSGLERDAAFVATERAYGGRAGWQRDRDAGRTKLTYGQWVQVRTPAFKAWFGDWEASRANPGGASKAVDPDTGEPMVVYHGTGADFVAFDEAADGNHMKLPGIYFSPDPDIASAFAENDAKMREDKAGRPFAPAGARVMPTYLSMQNPLVEDVSKGGMKGFYPASAIRELIVEAKRRGHDGVILRGWQDGSGPVQYIVFRPEQIKSATGNRGTFDPANADIRESRGGGAGLSPARVTEIADSMRAAWANAPEVVVVRDMRDPAIPQAVRDADAKQRSQGAKGDPEGFWYGGRAYLVASALASDADVVRVLAHEALGHYGLRGVFGKRLASILDQVALARIDKVRAKAAEYGLPITMGDARAVVRERQPGIAGAELEAAARTLMLDSRRQAAEEVLAVMAQRQPSLGFVRRAVAAVRTWLRTTFPRLNLRLSDAEIIRDYILPARAFVERGAGRADDGGVAFQRAWHGSPYTFDRFSTDAIGSGEGAQAYGWGLYFADRREVAEHYREALAAGGGRLLIDGKAPEFDMSGPGGTPGSADAALTNRAIMLLQHAKSADRIEKAAREIGADDAVLARARDLLPRVTWAQAGRLYEVEIPDDDQFMLWDKPLSEQPPKVRAALRSIMASPLWDADTRKLIGNADIKGSKFYQALAGVDEFAGRGEFGKAASLALRANGVAGIKYLDGNSRTSGAGSFNYVVFDDADVRVVANFSRRAGGTPAERAEAVIQKKVGSAAPIDAAARAITRVTGLERATSALYRGAAHLLDRYTPDVIKAGLVSDYGVPEAVIDQRAMLAGRQRVQLRKAGALIEKLSTLTREESRVAYEWMNAATPEASDALMERLPPDSIKVLADVERMIDALSREAVALGQLSKEAFERNRFAYLHRSYAKHTVALSEAEKTKRARVISILGDQYRGRGLTAAIPMDKIRNAAPDWWGRKLKQGKADTQLKGERFVRLERRDSSGQGTAPMDGIGDRSAGKLREIMFWPVGEPIPAQYSEWDQAGTWEVRDVKGGDAVMWRDFTKAEREKMGEIDEARFAIAKTLHGMIHDVEVGRYLEWLARTESIPPARVGEIEGEIVEASERYIHTFAPGQWVKVPETKVSGTNVAKYGKLAGHYLPGPVWNDLRQVVGGQFRPLGDTYAKILGAFKTAKTALSPAVHTNNVMSNFVMADWHDVHAAHIAKALRIILGASKREGAGLLGRVGNAAARAGTADRDAAAEILARYQDSGGDIGSWVTQEIARDQLEPLLESLQKEFGASGGASVQAQVGIMSALQLALRLRFPSAWDAFKPTRVGRAVVGEAKALIDLYQAEDDVFRLAAWLKAKEGGATDAEAGKLARRSFLDYHINAPWVAAMRQTAWPFISFTYRAVPMLIETAAKRPHKLMKLMMLAGALNALGMAMAGDGDDDERKLLPEEKSGRIWGMVPKLIRMPWNDAHGSPVYLDIRRFIPVGDVLDVGAGHAAIPMLPGLMPGGPLVLAGELVLNRSAFTGKPITLDTDTAAQKAAKVGDYLFKAFSPNLLGVPGTYATEGVVGSMTGRTDAFGREMSTAQAVASSFGVKLGSYPADVMRRNLQSKAAAQTMEIDRNIAQLKRQRQTGRMSQEEFIEAARVEQEKKARVQRELAERVR